MYTLCNHFSYSLAERANFPKQEVDAFIMNGSFMGIERAKLAAALVLAPWRYSTSPCQLWHSRIKACSLCCVPSTQTFVLCSDHQYMFQILPPSYRDSLFCLGNSLI